MTVSEQLLFTTTRITTKTASGQEGSATGFLYSVPTDSQHEALFLVTNKHVIANATEATVHFIASSDAAMTDADLGNLHELVITDPASQFRGHSGTEVDLAVLPVSRSIAEFQAAGEHLFFRSVSAGIALTNSSAKELDALEDITFVGYPQGIYDAANGTPIVRRGTTATPIQLDYQGLPMFLVDAAVHPGSSGSPVFIAQTGAISNRAGDVTIGSRLIWIGVISAVYESHLAIQSVATSFIANPIGLGLVYKAQAVDEVIDELLHDHGLERASATTNSPVATPDSTTDPLT